MIRPLLVLAACAGALLAQRDDAWRRDIQTFARELPERHGNFFQNLTRDEFDAAVRTLSDSVPQLTDGQITAGLLRIAAMARDAHTTVFHPLNILPVEVTWFEVGLFITAAAPEFTELIGARIVKLQDTTPYEALGRVPPDSRSAFTPARAAPKATCLWPIVNPRLRTGLSTCRATPPSTSPSITRARISRIISCPSPTEWSRI